MATGRGTGSPLAGLLVCDLLLRPGVLSLLMTWWLLGWQQPKFKARASVVYLPTRVQDRRGGTIYELTAEQFIVEDNDVREKIHFEEDPASKTFRWWRGA